MVTPQKNANDKLDFHILLPAGREDSAGHCKRKGALRCCRVAEFTIAHLVPNRLVCEAFTPAAPPSRSGLLPDHLVRAPPRRPLPGAALRPLHVMDIA